MENPALSTKALKQNYYENRLKYNGGNELQSKEFSDGSGLEMYDAVHRMYDPQIGRFGQIDPYAEVFSEWSPYSFANNNPILLNDPDGLMSDSLHPQDLAPVTVTPQKKNFNVTYIIDNTPTKKNPNYQFGTNTPFYIHYDQTPPGQWDPGKTDMLAKAMVVSASLIPAGRGLKWTYRMLKIFQRLKASEDVPLNLTEHGADQALKRGFTKEAIKKIMDEGTAAPGAGRYGPQTRYTLGENTVIVNEKDQIVTVFSSDMPSGNFIPFK